MKIIIAGSRNIKDYELVKSSIKNSSFDITEIVSGRCRGVDLLGERYGKENNIPIKPFPPDWNLHGSLAGIIRNAKMSKYADGLIAISRYPCSRGTSNIIKQCKENNLKIYVVIVENDIRK